MDRRDLDRLVEDICNVRYDYTTYDNRKSTTVLIGNYGVDDVSKKNAIEKAVYHWGEDMIDYKSAELGELKAKCYAYEQMIANSNFAPVLQQKIDIDAEELKERGKQIAWLSVLKVINDLELKYKAQYGSEIIEMYADIVNDLKDMLSKSVNNADTNP